MPNPFEKRATEYLRDDEAFLAVVSPEPLLTFFRAPAEQGRLFDRLVRVIGTPGSGKTTLARLFQYSTMRTLLRHGELAAYRSVVDALTRCDALGEGRPLVLGCRLPLESEYRDFWEFPYPEELKTGLMLALLQARAVLSWLRSIETATPDFIRTEIVPKAGAEAAVTAIGGTNGPALLERARQVELSIYRVSAALVPPDVADIAADAVAAYRPFDVIESVRVVSRNESVTLRPLVILDDAHTLHASQLMAAQRWLARRELHIARWMLMRLDALAPEDVLTYGGPAQEPAARAPGLKRAREITDIRLQSSDNRTGQRRAFRKMARDMAGRYLAQMPLFARRRLYDLGDLLATQPERLAASHEAKLKRRIESIQTRLGISAERRASFERDIARYLRQPGAAAEADDVGLAMLSIIMHRYALRIPQAALFEAPQDPEPARPVIPDAGIADGARIHLLQEFDRPYYFGLETVCDAASENAEQFLQLAARLVARAETQLIRGRPPSVRGDAQHKLLRERATEMVRQWDFPHHGRVRRLADWIGEQCVQKSREPNAPLDGGASAVGVLQEEFDRIPERLPALAQLLQFAVAYNVFTLVPQHGTKRRVWCLIELNGVLLLHYGLTLHRGGFLERTVDEIARVISVE